jgi:hypothetical protein
VTFVNFSFFRGASLLKVPLPLCTRQCAASGQSKQSGSAGRQMIAPSSMTAWFKSPGLDFEMSSSAAARNCFAPAILNKRPSTRRALLSTAG